ncbi:hypothetical protein [uncultured Jannaschia sp.]|uniref:hypothetical protein n=1 Tax=uncultured Jannaschia sp. TaxID=293347 RepID=UPI0026051C23|nr:hypothetical protein [uncultured Jannaschia sp.]
MLGLRVGASVPTPKATIPDQIVTEVLSFGLVTRLDRVTEELLVEAYETPDRPWIAAMFFAGFLLLLSPEDLLA